MKASFFFFPLQKEKAVSTSAGGLKLGVQHQTPISSSVSASSHVTATPKPQSQATSSDGWGFDDSEWGTFDAPPSQSAGGGGGVGVSGQSKQELLQKKREERRQKQQAAREKRAAGAGLKPSGLGAVKKD